MKMLQPSGPAHKRTSARTHEYVTLCDKYPRFKWKKTETEILKTAPWKTGRGPGTDRKSHHLLSAAVAGAAGVAGQQVLAVGGTAARPIRRLQDMPLLGETVIKSDWVKTTGGNIEHPIESFCLDGHVSRWRWKLFTETSDQDSHCKNNDGVDLNPKCTCKGPFLFERYESCADRIPFYRNYEPDKLCFESH